MSLLDEVEWSGSAQSERGLVADERLLPRTLLLLPPPCSVLTAPPSYSLDAEISLLV